MEEIRDWQILDESETVATGPLEDQFEADQRLLREVAAGKRPPTVRLWRHRGALALGHRDTRLPGWREAADRIAARGYAVAVRPSGGLAVPLDPGVLNIGLFYPDPTGAVDPGFRAMHRLLAACLRSLGLQPRVGEVPGGYCPGRSDVSVGGRKVAGVAQRRTRGGAGVVAFLLVEGEGAARGRLAAEFYRLAARAGDALEPAAASPDRTPGVDMGSLGPGPFLQVQPEAMVSLQELLGPTITAQKVAARLRALLTAGAVRLFADGPEV
ncbi:MAG: biotin--protein ligase [Firmicutes bacterium]|nr:biotin--protein ligase [Bacillota bacterium]